MADDTQHDPTFSSADIQQLSAFRYQLRCFLRHSEDVCREYGVTPLQYQLLLHLLADDAQWATVGELAERLQAKHHGTVMLVDRCEQSGLVKRARGREDRRRSEVHLLPRGARLARSIAARHQPELCRFRETFCVAGMDASSP
ncbi:MAG: MarR family winged helix-turn-helix transcriptional regulator [Halomonas sp.]|nr:MarR family winged helix-turn-helix transcriptional regulator [Halomonas sp.]MDN6297407.1 MarR family winged helix-turn-helix transcriptional regulator [Halomonas sp.]MDN6336299.1 MarR family winged helix-turn-helix transcriptional regulator [Halomonas sp.]